MIYAIANQKGGVGKTTTSVNFSVALAKKGKRVLLVDLDPQGNATSSLSIEDAGGRSLYRPLIGTATLEENILPTHLPNLWVIPADLDLAGAEIEVARMDNHLTRLREVFEPIPRSDVLDYVIIDCPPSLGILMTNALAAASRLIIPIQCEYFALEGLSKIAGVIEQIKASGANPDLAIGGILMTMFDSRTRLSQQVVNEVRTHFPQETFQTMIPRNVRISEAPSFGQSVIEYDPRSPGAIAYLALAEEFLQRESGQIRFVNEESEDGAIVERAALAGESNLEV